MLLLFASPAFLLLLSIFFGASATLIHYVTRVSLGLLLLVDLSVSLVIGVGFALDGYSAFGARDAAISLGTFGVLSFASLALGSIAWWLLQPAPARRRQPCAE